MGIPQKIVVGSAFTVLLVGLGTADALLTRGTLWLPSEDRAIGVAKQQGPDVDTLAAKQGLAAQHTSEDQLLQNILSSKQILDARVLLKDNDRAATIAWIDSPDVQKIFRALRERLRASFSPNLKDLIDETQAQTGKAPRDVLSFHDSAIRPDRLLFVRSRQRIYEIHVGEGHEGEIDRLIDALTE